MHKSGMTETEWRVMPEATHLVQEDAPEAVVATVLDFLHAEH
jgi:pimeloyl-ACP methyl ester carboxylesterase